jgi:hypothetical protein
MDRRYSKDAVSFHPAACETGEVCIQQFFRQTGPGNLTLSLSLQMW